MVKKTVTITDNSTGKSAEFPLIEGSHGPAAFDITGLYRELGLFTFDPRFHVNGELP